MRIYVPFFYLITMFITHAATGQVLVGPVAGANLSWISSDDDDHKQFYGNSPVVGYHVGADVSFRVQKRFFLNTSLLYSTKGKAESGKIDPLYNNTVVYKYIEMPIIYTAEFKGNFGGAREFKWYVGVGPTVSYWLGGRGKLRSSDLMETSVRELDYKIVFHKNPEEVGDNEMVVQNPNRIQLGVNLATGLVLEPVGFQKIIVMLRYEIGHSFLSGESNGVVSGVTYADDMRVRNHGFRLSLAYVVDLKTADRKKGKSTLDKKIKKLKRR